MVTPMPPIISEFTSSAITSLPHGDIGLRNNLQARFARPLLRLGTSERSHLQIVQQLFISLEIFVFLFG